MNKIRVRFAPSPTGPLHIGGARTALFNWLFARKNNGVMVLRIEDTDLERSTEKSERNILRDLKWLGIDWDEGPGSVGPMPPIARRNAWRLTREYTERLWPRESLLLLLFRRRGGGGAAAGTGQGGNAPLQRQVPQPFPGRSRNDVARKGARPWSNSGCPVAKR